LKDSNPRALNIDLPTVTWFFCRSENQHFDFCLAYHGLVTAQEIDGSFNAILVIVR